MKPKKQKGPAAKKPKSGKTKLKSKSVQSKQKEKKPMPEIMKNPGKKLALLVGIDKYLHLNFLDGCVNDVELMQGILQTNFHFPPENITRLQNEKATRGGILAAMKNLAGQAAANDIIVFHYAGHGSQMTDREGDETGDGMDETIMPYDTGRRPNPNRDITDDEIHEWLMRVSKITPFVTLIFDCCHSGTISRDPFGGKSRWVEGDDRPVAELPPSPITGKATRSGSRDAGPSGWFPLSDRYVLIAGCRDDEEAGEITVQSVDHGALTYYLCQELLKLAPGEAATYRDVFERASAAVTKKKSRQHPQMEGAQDRQFFGVQEFEPMRFVAVKQRRDQMVTLSGGVAHGMTAGSKWAIYPQAAKQVAAQTPRLGLVEIIAVRATTSDAKILEETSANAIKADSRAVEEAHHYGEFKLVVDIQAPIGYDNQVNELSGLLDDSKMLRRAEPGESTEVRAYLIPPRTQAKTGDAAPQLGAVSEATWALIGNEGRLIMPVHALSEPDAAQIILENLEKKFRFDKTLELANPNKDGLLNGRVAFTLKRKKGSQWVEAVPDQRNGKIVFAEGEALAFAITNKHSAPIYVSVLDLGLTGKVSQLYPVRGANEPLAPNQTLEFGARAGEELELFFPENFPFVLDPVENTPTEGVETLKVLATTQEANFRWLTQEEGYRSGVDPESGRRGIDLPGSDSPLGRLLSISLSGEGTRDARPVRVAAQEEWTAVSRSFVLRQNAS